MALSSSLACQSFINPSMSSIVNHSSANETGETLLTRKVTCDSPPSNKVKVDNNNNNNNNNNEKENYYKNRINHKVQPSPSSYAVMKKMNVLNKDLNPHDYQESMNKASAALALSALFNGGSGSGGGSGNSSSGIMKSKIASATDGTISESDDDRINSSSSPPMKRMKIESRVNGLGNTHINSSGSSSSRDNGSNLIANHRTAVPSTTATTTAAITSSSSLHPSTNCYNMAPSSTPVSMSGRFIPFSQQGYNSQQQTMNTSFFPRKGSPIPIMNYNINRPNSDMKDQYNIINNKDAVAINLAPSSNNHVDETKPTVCGPQTMNGYTPVESTKRNFAAVYQQPAFVNRYLLSHNGSPPTVGIPSTSTTAMHSRLHDGSNTTASFVHNGNRTVTPSPIHQVHGNSNILKTPALNQAPKTAEMNSFHFYNQEQRQHLQHQREQYQKHHQMMNGMFLLPSAHTPSYATPAKNPQLNNKKNSTTVATNLQFTPNTLSSLQQYQGHSNNAAYKRKDKSLGLLCSNFIEKYSTQLAADVNAIKSGRPAPALSIDEAAELLHVERRRIYDIINILEALHVVSRKCKNMYFWYGLDGLPGTFCHLQKEGIEVFKDDAICNGFLINNTITETVAPTVAPPEELASTQNNDMSSTTNIMSSGLAMLLAAGEVHEKSSNRKRKNNKKQLPLTKKVKPTPNTKEKSLAKLSQKFIQLFLVGNETVAMSDASHKILGPTLPKLPEGANEKEKAASAKLLKTKIRRLYDVANVLVSMRIIRKLNVGNNMNNNSEKHRPSFQWIYPVRPLDMLRLQTGSTNNVSRFSQNQYY